MYITKIILDGFKSYAKRTEITGFDPCFNAITGLNGSGKSNILDAICFVMGITNLSHVRAENLQDLIFKSGQTGITKATVTLIFDNTSKVDSPAGYDSFDELTVSRQIAVGGKSKYCINGITATNTRVADLFRSVQLNVNNPHFLIMQGRITKVLNMKPPEILSLLEEAASTKHYESKREYVLSSMDKKEGKLREIKSVLCEDIEPKLTKLRLEVANYKQYQQVTREIEISTKYIVAHQYISLRKVLDDFDNTMEAAIKKEIKESNEINECDDNKKIKEAHLEKQLEIRDKEYQSNCDALISQQGEMNKAEVLLRNAIKRKTDEKKVTQGELKHTEETLKKETSASNGYRKQIATIQAQYDGMRESVQAAKTEFELATKNVNDVNMGMFAVSGQSGAEKASLAEILRLANREEAELQKELSNIKIKIRHCEVGKKDIEKKLFRMSRDGDGESKEKQHKEFMKQRDDLEKKISTIEFSEEKFVSLQNESKKLNNEKHKLQIIKDRILIENNLLDFQYKRPNSNKFDEKAIYGVVARLVKLNDSEFSTAMEIIAGGRIYNVVVRDDEVGTILFNQDCLYRRTTLLPLSRMEPYVVPEHKFLAAQTAFGEKNVWHPIKQLLEFDEWLRPAISHVFGSCLIARDLKTAKEIAFNPRCGGVRCVTLEGDMFDPEGTLVGGCKPKSKNVLLKSNLLNETIQRLVVVESKSCDIHTELNNLEGFRCKFEDLNEQLSHITSKINDLEVRMMENDYLGTQHQLSEITNELTSLNEKCAKLTKSIDETSKKTVEAKKNLEDSKKIQDQAKKIAEERLGTATKMLEDEEVRFRNTQAKYEELNAKLQTNEESEADLKAQIEVICDKIRVADAELKEEEMKLINHEANCEELKKDLKKVTECIGDLNNEIQKTKEDIKQLMQDRYDANVRLDNAKHFIVSLNANRKDTDRKLKTIVQKHGWIEEEKELFGQSGTLYDFQSRPVSEVETRINKLEKEKEILSKKVDMRGMNVLAPKEKEYKQLTDRYNKVKDDKVKIHSVIEDLDKLRKTWIENAYKKVNQDFNDIFSTLLPGSQASLVPPEGTTIFEGGLEFRIAMGNVWKESLGELSGGQRSLVALSLVLALLRFKPAPLYILDEVDAALDISHTVNIGTMIRQHFQNSQFLVVSLKDGMFNNANVLFKTQFVDGVSQVTRQENYLREKLKKGSQ